MNVKMIAALMLGLVFQLAQVMSAAVIHTPCTPDRIGCECCEGLDSCPCAANEKPDQNPSPLTSDTSGILKIPAMRTADIKIPIESIRKIHHAASVAASPQTTTPAGFTGIRLPVAFCSLVI